MNHFDVLQIWTAETAQRVRAGVLQWAVVIGLLVPYPVLAQVPTFELAWGSSGSGVGQFVNPEQVAVDASGNVYVADGSNNRIQKFNSNGVFISQWGTAGSGNGQFSGPTGIAVDVSGNVYVVDLNNGRVQKFNSSGVFLAKWGTSGSGDGQFSQPRHIAVDASGNVYVADQFNNRIQKFNSNGVFLAKWGIFGSGDGQFNRPFGIAVDASGNVYVTELANNRVQKFNSSGVFLAKWGSSGSSDGQFSTPHGIAVDAAGNVYVNDGNNHRIQKFNSSGAFLAKWGSFGGGNGQFNLPNGIAVSTSNSIYVTDLNNRRVQKFSSNQSVTTQVFTNTAAWKLSTGVGTGSNTFWSGVSFSNVPAASTFTLTPVQHSPFIAPVPGATILFADSGVRYYRTTFTLPTFNKISADIQMSVDNGMQIFINGYELALEGSFSAVNFQAPLHRLFVNTNESVANGYLGGDPFDTFAATFPKSNWVSGGTNELILAVVNPSGAPIDQGSFALAMTLVTSSNQPPVANAGVDQEVVVGSTVQLNGSVSSDPDNDPLTYNWQIVSSPIGTSAFLSNASAVNPTFVPNVAGNYVVELVVNDGSVNSVPDQVTIAGKASVVAPAGLTNWWKGENDANDSVGGINGTQGTGGFDAGKVGRAFRYTGSSSSGTSLNTTTGNFGTSNFTIDFWMKSSAPRSPNLTEPLIVKRPDNLNILSIQFSRNTGRVSVELRNNNDFMGFDGIRDINDGAWHHIALVRSGTLATLYIDGTLDQSGSTSNIVNLNNTAAQLNFGKNLLSSLYYTGLMDDVHFFNRALPLAEIQSIFNAGVAGLSPNASPVANAGANQTLECAAPTGSVVTLNGSGSSDPDNDALIYTWRKGGNVIAGPTTSATSDVTLGLGSHTIQLTVEDGKGGSAIAQVVVQVVDTTAPVITLLGDSPVSVICGLVYADAGATASDLCDGDVTASIVAVNPVDVSVPGVYTITYNVSDGADNAAAQVTRTVTVINPAPELTAIADQVVNEGETLSVSLAATVSGNKALALSVSSLSFGSLTDNGDGTGVLTLTPGFEDAGTYAMTVTATNTTGSDLTDSKTFTLTVVNVNRSPVIAGPAGKPGDQSLDEGQVLVIQLTAVDPDGNTPTLTTGNVPVFGTFANNGDGTSSLSFAPDFTQAGTYADITVTASDGDLSDAVVFTLLVNHVNRAPVAVAQDVTVNLDAAGVATLDPSTVNNGSSDPDGDAIVLSLDKTSFVCDDLGSVMVTLTVSDGSLSSSAQATVTVVDHIAPVVVTKAVTVELSATGQGSIAVDDVNNGSSDNCEIVSLTLSKTAFDCTNLGANTVTLTAVDQSGNSASATAVVTVKDVTPPTLVSITEPIGLECSNSVGEAVTLTVVASDVCDQNLDIKWYDGVNNYLGNTSSITVTFVLGTHEARVVVTDDSGNASVGTVSVVIQDSTSPDVIAALEYTHKPSKKNDDDDDDGGSGNWHKVVAKAVDLCDANPVVTALITQPLIGSDVLDVKYKQDRKKTEIDIKIKDRKIDVTLRGVSEGVMRGLLNQAIMQGGFTVVNGQIINAKATASEKEKDDDDDDNKNKHKDDRKGDYQYAFDASLNLEEAKGVYLSLVVSAKDASGNMSDPVSAQPKKQKASKPALSKPALADDVGEVETAVMLTFGAKNFPNPFNPETMIQYTVPEVSDVRLVIYSSLGQQVRELVNASQSAGQYSVRWDGKDALGRSVSSGVYFYHLIAGSNSAINKMVLMK